MSRPFAPKRFMFRDEDFKRLKEQALTIAGEYVRHIPVGGDPQWIVMNHQYIPDDYTDGNGALFIKSGSDPILYGLFDHFETKPDEYKDATPTRPARGSQFEVNGITYRSKKTSVNHRGYITVPIVRERWCETPREEFFTERDALLCDIPTCETETETETETDTETESQP